MKKALMAAALAAAAFTAGPATAAILVNGSSLVPPTPFAAIAGSQGTLLAYQTFSGTTETFAAEVRQAVYRNSLGTLDF